MVVNQRIQRVCETTQVSVSVSIARAGLGTEVDPPFSEPIEDLAATVILPYLHPAQCRRLSLSEISFQFLSTSNVLASVNPIEPMPRPDRCLTMAMVYCHQIDVRGREFCRPGWSHVHHVTAGLLQAGSLIILTKSLRRTAFLLVVVGAHHEIGKTILRHDACS